MMVMMNLLDVGRGGLEELLLEFSLGILGEHADLGVGVQSVRKATADGGLAHNLGNHE